jgi:hypothetical protein
MSLDCVNDSVKAANPAFGKKSKVSGKEIPKGYSETKKGNFYKKEHVLSNTAFWGGFLGPVIYDVVKSKGFKAFMEKAKSMDASLASYNPKVNIIALATWCAGLMIDHKINKNRAAASDKIASGDYMVK